LITPPEKFFQVEVVGAAVTQSSLLVVAEVVAEREQEVVLEVLKVRLARQRELLAQRMQEVLVAQVTHPPLDCNNMVVTEEVLV
jgi:hypothetical protein